MNRRSFLSTTLTSAAVVGAAGTLRSAPLTNAEDTGQAFTIGATNGRGFIRKRLKASSFAIGMLLGSSAALLGGLLVLVLASRDPTPQLFEADFDAAVDRWKRHGLQDYNLEVHITVAGEPQGVVLLEVRDGQPAAMTRNGIVPKRHAWDVWTVEGQFDMIARELENAANPQPAHGVSDPSLVVLRASFDPQLGYPRKFHRDVLGKRRQAMQWEVVKFETTR